jgi:acetyl esterase/lipase
VRTLVANLHQRPAAEQRRLLQIPAWPVRGVRVVADSLGGREARTHSIQDADRSALIVYFHGGGYVIGGIDQDEAFCGTLARASATPITTVDYRLAPEHPYPAALEDACAAVRDACTRVDPARVCVAGDSAGGGLALATLVRLRDEDGPRVGGAILGSPVVDLSLSGASMATNASADILTPETMDRWASMYAGGTDVRDVGLSPGLADLGGLPPLMFIAGDSELLADDIVACADAAERAGVTVERLIGEQAVHCWYRAPSLFPGPRGTTRAMARFAHRCFDGEL